MNDALALAQKKIARLIARRYYSEYELRMKLKEFSSEVQEEVVAWAKEQGFIDDLRFCRAFVHDALLLNPQGKRLLTRNLAKKGIEGTVIEQVLQEEYPTELEVELAQKLAEKYSKRLKAGDERKHAKLYGYLLSRGFPENIVYLALKEVNLDTQKA